MPSSLMLTRPPIAIFAYNRADHLERMFDSLVRCDGFAQSRVTVFIDGPRRATESDKVENVRRFVEGLDLPNLSYIASDTNKGLRRSIYSGVSSVISQHDRAIVLEDDLILSRDALNYFNDALEKYENETNIWSVVGYCYDAPELRSSREALILPFAHPWGWATWRRAWSQFDVDGKIDASDLCSPTFRRLFDMNNFYPFSRQLLNASRGTVDSWFIRWYYTIFRHGGSSVFPPVRVVENYGVSSGGTHSSRLNPYDMLVERPPLLEGPVLLPDIDHGNDYWALDLMRRSRELRVQRLIAGIGDLRRKLRHNHARKPT